MQRRRGRASRATATRVFSCVHALDRHVDALVERIRSPQLDPVFYGLSSAADHGLLWLLMGSVRAARKGDPAIALRMGAVLSVESLLTNGAIKACFRRVRPTDDHPAEDPLPYGMHRPISSSFPSGHATSAFTAAVLLAGGPGTPALFALAAVVASSRVYTRMHHASDVVAGAALGIVLGTVARRLLPLG